MATSDNQALLLQVSADISRLEKQFAKATAIVDKGARSMEQRAQTASTNLERFFGKTDPGKALEHVFDSSRLRLFDTATARIGLTGGALEALGPAGIAAAAGIAAVGVALDQAHKAVEFADNIFRLAKNAHVTTDELQEFAFALEKAGGNGEEASAGLASFSAVLGKAQEGLPRAQRAFLALGFTKAQIKDFKDAGDALIAVTERIGQLKSNAQKDAIVSQLGLDQMKPLIEGGAVAMRGFLDEARAAGVVMDAGLVVRGHELNEELKEASTRISVQLKSAFIEVGPLLVDIVTQVAKLAEFAANAAKSIHDFVLDPTTAEQLHLLAEVAHGLGHGGLFGASKAAFDAGVDANAHAQGLRETAARDRAIRATTGATDTAGGAREDDPDFIRRQNAKPAAGTRSLIDQGKHPAGPRDDTKERQDQVDAAVAQAEKARLQALAALTGDLQARAEFERQALVAEATAEKARLQKQIDEIQADKGIKDPDKKARLEAELEIAKLAVDQAADAKRRKIDRDTAFAIEDVEIEVHKALVEAQLAELDAQAKIASTAQERTLIEARILALRQELERDLKGTALDREVAKGEKTPEQAAQVRGAQSLTQSAERDAFALAHLDPIHRYARSIQDLNTVFQNAGVGAIEDLANGFADAIVNARSLGDVASNVFKQLIAQLIAASTKQLIVDVLAFIPGFASGTDFAPGGLALVGERGPELVNLPRGSHVTPGNQTLSAIKALQTPQRAVTAVNVVQPIHLHMEGAVMTRELIQNVNEYADRQAARAYAGARRDSRQDQAGISYANNLNR